MRQGKQYNPECATEGGEESKSRRIAELESQAAVLREALEIAIEIPREGAELTAAQRQRNYVIRRALSTDAGKHAAEVLRAAETFCMWVEDREATGMYATHARPLCDAVKAWKGEANR